jgi:ABC-type branched-subunit amino acid transport system substrate-binding protein|tara:strand:+ start:4963 stop:6222 length:1260 start_codon:yes stop_codon:yes gene_type:complete
MINNKILYLFLLLFTAPTTWSETFEIGGLYTYHYHDGRYADWGDYARVSALMAIEDINKNNFLGDSDQLNMSPENLIDYHCWPSNAAVMAETLIKKNILILTGTDCSSPAVEIAKVASEYKIPVISNGANASSLSSKENYPWFIRVVTPSEEYDRYLIELAAHFKVKEIAYFYTTDAWGLGAKKVVHESVKKKNIIIKKEFGFERDTNQTMINKYMQEVKEANIKHIVVTGPTPDTARVFRAIGEYGLNKKGNTIYATEMISADEALDVVKGSKGYFAPMTLLLKTKQLDKFKQSLEKKLGKDVDVNSKAFFYGALSYDHIMTIGHAIKIMKDNDIEVSRKNLMPYLRNVDFQGVTGRVYFSKITNDRINMPLQIVNSHGLDKLTGTVKFESIATATSDGGLIIDNSKILLPGYNSLVK